RLPAYKVRPAENVPPHKFETGTPSFENIHAAAAAVNYLASAGETFGANFVKDYPAFSGRRLHLKTGMRAIQAYEKNLFIRLFNGLREIPGLRFYGITDLTRFDYRAPTAAFNLDGRSPQAVAAALGEQNINVWDGNYYALALMERLDLERTGGAVRVGLAQYNTVAEIDRLLAALHGIAQ
ncbi:MAG: aminotransferase class V-fold PLP-dependent enzyme, partial [Chloroflexi bacterium]|nr:aminotransferase class V-fold PLP-dependent enzyme [Chloroflexota bacterium]